MASAEMEMAIDTTTPPPTPGCADNTWNPAMPDLSDVPSAQLRKVPDQNVRPMESWGGLYHDIFRRLQIKPAQYQQFYDGVIRFVRNKHPDEIKRGTDASIQHMTDLTLRAFGYIVWTQGSSWLLTDAELEEGEGRLMHVRGFGKENEDNARFYPIFEELWSQMRNVLFERRPPPRPRGQTARRRANTRTPARQSDRQGLLHLSDPESSSSAPAPANNTFQRSRVETTRRTDTMQGRVHTEMPPDSSRQMTASETESGITDLIVRLSQIRARSDPNVFASLWEQHIMRIDEFDAIEAGAATTEREEHESSPPIGTTPNSSQSNEPWIARGNPTEPGLFDSTLLPPIRPAVMSIYISVQHVASPVLLPENLNRMLNPTAAASDVAQQAYHWPDAPVEDHTMHRFFTGINWRIKDHVAKILGYTFSYGWNDGLRFVSTGRLECRALAEEDTTMAREQGAEAGGQGGDAMDMDDGGRLTGHEIEGGRASNPTANVTGKKSDVSQSVEFHLAQYRFLGMGWQQLQEDLDHAATKGVRIYRMKVGVLALARTAQA